MSHDQPEGVALATITITKVLTEDDVQIFVDSSSENELSLVEALGMLELAKDTVMRTRMGEGP